MPRCTSSGPSASRRARALVHASASMKSPERPAPPWSWMAKSMTCWAMVGAATLIWLTSDSASSGPPRSSFQAALSTSSRVGVDGDPGVGDPLPVAAEVDQRLAEGGAGQAAAAGGLERGLGQADQPHAVVHPAGPEPPLGDRERLTGSGDDVGDGDPDVGERHLAVAERLVRDAHRGEHPLDLDARGVGRDEHHRVPVVPVGVGVCEPHEDDDLAVAVADAGGPPLAPVDDHLVPVDDRGGLHGGGVGGGHAGLGHPERAADPAVQQRFEPLGLLRVACRSAAAPPCCRCPGRCS